MIIIETQEGGVIREYELPEHQREAWTNFFNWLVSEGEIVHWSSMPSS